MDTTFCGITAFLLYRIPPPVLALCENDLDLSTPRGRRRLGARTRFLSYLPVPISLVVRDREACHRARGITFRLLTADLPAGAFREIDAAHAITSPALTLFTMAGAVSRHHLVMAMYELCGTFSCLRLSPEHRTVLQARVDAGDSLCEDGWRPVLDRRGRLTDLWQRPALVTVDELVGLSAQLAGAAGSKEFARAVKEIRGVTASPFEARAAMRLCGSRLYGGWGLGPVMLNHAIRTNTAARDAVYQERVVLDQYYPAMDDREPFGIECQGRVVHGGGGVTHRDANRLLALRYLGIDTILLMPEQIADEHRFRHVVELVESRLGVHHRDKTPRQLRNEAALVRDLFIDWSQLGYVV